MFRDYIRSVDALSDDAGLDGKCSGSSSAGETLRGEEARGNKEKVLRDAREVRSWKCSGFLFQINHEVLRDHGGRISWAEGVSFFRPFQEKSFLRSALGVPLPEFRNQVEYYVMQSESSESYRRRHEYAS